MPRIKDLFVAALDLEPEARAVFLDRECPDPELRKRLDVLLHAHDDPDSAVAGPLAGRTGTYAPDEPATGTFGNPDSTSDHNPQPDAGTIIAGKYKLIELIGEGGMGSVWMAQQTEPVKRAVAVKLIKAGMDSKAVLARFDAERQALAVMDHPNIARVLDGGATPDGRPFFVMELVKGVPITQFCDERKLTPHQRLELFIPVCQAIQHAHQKGVIHRDIKPNNVLVALYDDRPVPKVIDFGVAKATGTTLTDHTLMTGFGAVVGTPEYMSPEQASLNNLDVDTRSDVYSLGVLLYELLTGTTPVDRKSLGKAMILEVLRIVREVEAPRPSAKLSSSGTLPSVAANRSTDPAKLSWLLKRDLDWIVLKSLEKDRSRRYESANGLAADVQRYLAGEAVQAHPPSTSYRLRKFARKNRGVLATVTAFALLMVAGVAVSSWLAVKARRAEGVAEDRRIEAEKNAKEAKSNAEAFATVNEANVFGHVDTEIKSLSLQVDLDLLELQTDRKIGLLKLARPLPDSIGPIITTIPGRNEKLETFLGLTHSPEYRALREFVTVAVLAAGQDDAPLLPPITHDGYPVVQLSISPDGQTLLTRGNDATARLWNLRTNRQIAVLREGPEQIVTCGFSQDGRTAFTDDRESVARFWAVPDGTLRGKTDTRPNRYAVSDEFSNFAFLRREAARIDGNRLLTISYVLQKSDDRHSAFSVHVGSDAFMPAGAVDLWDTSSGRLVARLDQPGRDSSRFKFLADGRWLVTTDGESTVLILSPEDGRMVARLDHPRGTRVQHIDASPSGRQVATMLADGEFYIVRIWDTHNWLAEPMAMRLKRGGDDFRFWTEDMLACSTRDPFSSNIEAWDVYRLGRNEPAVTFSDLPNSWDLPPPVTGLMQGQNGQVFEDRNWQRLRPPTGKKYHPDLVRLAQDGRFVNARLGYEDVLIDMKTEKYFPIERAYWWHPLVKLQGIGLFTAVDRLVDGYGSQVRLLVTSRLDLPPHLLELWAQVAVRGELGPDGEFVKWDETTWEKKRQQLAAIPSPNPDLPFPGYVATDKLHWLRAEFGEAKTKADKLRIAKELLRRSEASGDRNEAVRWRQEVEKHTTPVAPAPREVKP